MNSRIDGAELRGFTKQVIMMIFCKYKNDLKVKKPRIYSADLSF